MRVDTILSNALSGSRLPAPTHGVRGTDPRGVQFDIRHFRNREDAVSYAGEVNGNGGNVVFYRL